MLFKKHTLFLGVLSVTSIGATSELTQAESLRLSATDIRSDSFVGIKAPSRLEVGRDYLVEADEINLAAWKENTASFISERIRWNHIDFETVLIAHPALEGLLRPLLKKLNRTIPPSTTLTTLNFILTDEGYVVEKAICCRSIDLPPSLKTKLNTKGKVKRRLTITTTEANNIKDALAYLSSGLFTKNRAIDQAGAAATLELAERFERAVNGEALFEPTVKPVKIGRRRK